MVSSELSLSSLTRSLIQCIEGQGIVVEELYLFGSHARGDATPESDLDILVVSKNFVAQGFWQRCARLGQAISGLPMPVQLYPVTPLELQQPESGGFVESIRPDLRQIYKRKRKPKAGIRVAGGNRRRKR